MQKQIESTKKIVYEVFFKTKNISEKFYAKVNIFFDFLGKWCAKFGISANIITLTGLVIGLFALNFIAMQMYMTALLFILLNRFCDGLDGAVARHVKITDFGIFLDTACDYIFYAALIFGFALANPQQNASAAAFLLFAFTTASVTMLAYAVVAYKKKKTPYVSLSKSPFYLWGFAQGFETFIALVLMCLMPSFFIVIAVFFGLLSLVKAVGIMINAYYVFEISEKAEQK